MLRGGVDTNKDSKKATKQDYGRLRIGPKRSKTGTGELPVNDYWDSSTPKGGNRRWIAWKLVGLAERIYPSQRYERIYVSDPVVGTMLFEAVIVGDIYGAGVSSIYGGRCLPTGASIYWDEDYRPDWLGSE